MAPAKPSAVAAIGLRWATAAGRGRRHRGCATTLPQRQRGARNATTAPGPGGDKRAGPAVASPSGHGIGGVGERQPARPHPPQPPSRLGRPQRLKTAAGGGRAMPKSATATAAADAATFRRCAGACLGWRSRARDTPLRIRRVAGAGAHLHRRRRRRCCWHGIACPLHPTPGPYGASRTQHRSPCLHAHPGLTLTLQRWRASAERLSLLASRRNARHVGARMRARNNPSWGMQRHRHSLVSPLPPRGERRVLRFVFLGARFPRARSCEGPASTSQQ